MKEKTLAEILTPRIIGVPADTPLAATLARMRQEGISAICVLEGQKPVGIFTERNIVALAADLAARVDTYLLRDLMSRPVRTARKSTGLYEAYHVLEQHRIRHLVVVDDDGAAIGMVTQSNILANLDYDYFVEVKRIGSVMSRDAIGVPPGLPVQQAMILMKEEAASCVVVVEEKRPVGIVTERDAARVLLDNEDITLLPISRVMSQGIFTVERETPLHEAVRIMQQNKVRRLVVVNRAGELEGMVAQSDVVKGLEGRYIAALTQIIREKEDRIASASRDLVQKTAYLDNILRSSVDNGIIAMGLDFRIMYYNPAAERILGFAATEVIGQDVRSIHRRINLGHARFQTAIRAIYEGSSFSFEMEIPLGDAQRYVQSRASGILDPSGRLIGFFLMLNDVTEAKLAEIQLRQARDGLEQRVRERTAALAQAMEGAIQAMALTVEMRDPYTSGHQRRVAQLAAAIAREMGLDEKTVEGVYMAGLIHDIGKIRVPSGILCNPGRLTEAEFAIIKPHPEIGYNILKGIEFPWPIAQIVLQHHERLDGSGYPRALKNGAILLEARILAVADVVEAMYSHRPYRPSLGIERALEAITSGRGQAYDPDVVDVCIGMLASRKFELPADFKAGEWI